jgi:SAM-dependent methyltransferase
MDDIINKSMDRADLLTAVAEPIVSGIHALIRKLYLNDLQMTSWYGSLRGYGPEANEKRPGRIARIIKYFFNGWNGVQVGLENRGPDYEPLPGAPDDGRIPWFLYWEIVWVLTKGPRLSSPSKLLDCGGTSSLFSCYLASLGHDVHSVDINPRLIANANRIAREMNWKMSSYPMNMRQLEFPDVFFDHAYSICVFEHLDCETKQKSLAEIARVLKPNGVLSITFDFRNPRPAVVGQGFTDDPQFQLSSLEDIERNFLSTGLYDIVGNTTFSDNGLSYLIHPFADNTPYTFGAIFLRKRSS